MKKLCCLLVLLLSLPFGARADGITVSGTVTDARTGQPVESVNVFIVETQQGAITGPDGRYSFSVGPGRWTLSASHVSYSMGERSIEAVGDMVADFVMEPDIRIEEVVVSSRPADTNVTGVLMGVDRLSIEQVRKMPSLLGEVDVIKAIQMMPGVQMASEGGSGFSVRGGSPDQNLILLDESTVYNASHLMGFFSIFNNDIISAAELYKGDMPLRYGGRLASLLDVKTIERQPERFSGTGGVGLISSRVMLEGPIGPNTSWMVGGRRSYADIFLGLAKDRDLRGATLYFYDTNAKLIHRFSRKDMIQASGYYGRDVFGMKNMGRFNYGNGAATLTWRHIYNDDFLSRLSFNFTDYNYGMSSSIEGLTASWRSGITDYQLRMDFEQNLSRYWNLTYGVSSTFRQFDPGKVSMESVRLTEVMGNNALEHTLYVSNEQQLGERLILRYGLRFSLFQNMGEAEVYNYDENYESLDSVHYRKGKVYHTYPVVEPRVGMVVRTGRNSSVKASYAGNTQFMQLANNSASGSPLDVWFAAGPNIKPQRSHMVSVGYFQNLRDNMFELSAEVYYKSMRNVIDFKDGADLMLNGKLDGEVRTGSGQSYGLELMASKEKGAWTGFINYTLSRSERAIPGINGGRTYLAPYDKTHSVNLSVSYEISPSWEVALSWVYATGNPTTYPVARFIIDGKVNVLYSDRNAYRFPDYHRLDLSVTWRPPHKSTRRWHGEWNVSAYNVYNKKNPWMVRFLQYESGVTYAQMVYLFGIVPSITYNFRF